MTILPFRETQSAPTTPRLSCRNVACTEGVLPGMGIGSPWDAAHNERNSCWGKPNASSPRPTSRPPRQSEATVEVLRPAGMKRGDMEMPSRWETLLIQDRASSEERRRGCSSDSRRFSVAKERSDSVKSWHAGSQRTHRAAPLSSRIQRRECLQEVQSSTAKERFVSSKAAFRYHSDPWAGIQKPIPEAIFKGTSITTDSTVLFSSPRLGERRIRRELASDKLFENGNKHVFENLLWGSASLGAEACVPDLFSDSGTPTTSPTARTKAVLRTQKANLTEQLKPEIQPMPHSQLQAPYAYVAPVQRKAEVVDVSQHAPYRYSDKVNEPTESVSLQDSCQLPYASDEQPPSPTLSLPGTSRRLRSPLSPRSDDADPFQPDSAMPSDPAEVAEMRGSAAGVGPQQDQYHHKSRRPALFRRDPAITRPRQPFPGAVGLWSEVLSSKTAWHAGAVKSPSRSPRVPPRGEVMERVIVKATTAKRPGIAVAANSPKSGCRDVRSPQLKSPRACWR
mmetsp:Transcript_71308/g.126010  ORF Transcript_71308/g.126010 Transcript_71308/m.126010 type:complete len:508 (+) Transcript_71308:111-1634(+)